MKKLLSIVLALVLVLSVASCSLFGGEKDSAASAEKTVESFMDALVDFDFKKLKNYIDDEDALPDEIADFDLEANLEKIIDDMPAELDDYSDDLRSIFNDLIDKIKKEISYEIKETTKDEDSYIVTVEVTLPDMDSVNFENLLTDSMDESSLMNILNEMIESGKITENTTEQEMFDLLMPEVFKIMEDAIKDIEFETTTDEKEFVVVKSEDDKWVIDVEESELD